jgi:hypothetical protein
VKKPKVMRAIAVNKSDSTSFPVAGSAGELEGFLSTTVFGELGAMEVGVVAAATGVHCACTTKLPSAGENDELYFVPPV